MSWSPPNVFKALGEPTRLRLLQALLHEERCVHDLSESLEIEQSAVSHQLRVLRNLRLVARRKQGRHAYYALEDQHIRTLLEVAIEHIEHTPAG